jgi:alkanesulfonate monooxygenase SsuD/methylene tetrahydromethanopterin reductase-like flavin-dependent oxidoreductase (luciferase family)
MKYGFVYPGGEARQAAEHARAAEAAGWDGFFVWDPVWGEDAWVTMTAIAMLTERIRFGTMITPISRRRPWNLAGETATLDRLSGGRLILSVGLGAIDTGFVQFGEVTDRKTRAELLDEGLDVLTGLWRGQPFLYDGKHYHVKETSFLPPLPPLQQPRIPIWVVGAWPRPKSLTRAARYDGLLPAKMEEGGKFAQVTPEDIRAMRDWIQVRRAVSTPYDIIMEGNTHGKDAEETRRTIREFETAGVTWWLEADWSLTDHMYEAETQRAIRKILEAGPPK